MVNTRILEQRLGWQEDDDGDALAPPAQPIGHAPLLQGRVEMARPGVMAGVARHQRRAAVEDAWARLPVLLPDVAQLSTQGKAPDFGRGSSAGAALDQLRTQLMRVMGANGWRRIGVTSPTRGAGRSFIAAGLAASIARLETARVLLIDTDLEAPGLDRLLGLEAPGPLETVLSGERDPLTQLRRVGDTLALALNRAPVPQAAERMQSAEAILALRGLIDALSPEVVIQELPPLLDDSVTQALLPQLDGVLLVSDGRSTTARDILESERLLEGQVPLLGIVLNKSEDRDPRPAARRRG